MCATHAIAASAQPLVLQTSQLRPRRLGARVQGLSSRGSKLRGAELVQNSGFLSSGSEPLLLMESGILTGISLLLKSIAASKPHYLGSHPSSATR